MKQRALAVMFQSTALGGSRWEPAFVCEAGAQMRRPYACCLLAASIGKGKLYVWTRNQEKEVAELSRLLSLQTTRVCAFATWPSMLLCVA